MKINCPEERLAKPAIVAAWVRFHAMPGVQSASFEKAVPLAREANDLTAEAVRRRPDRFQGFAALPTPLPDAAARELDRAMKEPGLDDAMMFGGMGERWAGEVARCEVKIAGVKAKFETADIPSTPSLPRSRARWTGRSSPSPSSGPFEILAHECR